MVSSETPRRICSLAPEAVELAFQSARAQATLLGETSVSPSAGAASAAPAENYAQTQNRISRRIADNQTKLDTLNKHLSSQTRGKTLLAERDALSGQIDLDKAMLEAIERMSAFVELNTVNKGGLEGSINELANSIPEVVAPADTVSAKTQNRVKRHQR